MRTRSRRSLISGAGIVDSVGVGRTLREITGALQRGGDDSFQVERILLADLLEIHKKEGLVFLHRPAESEAILISNVIRLFTSVEEVPRIKVGSLAVPPAAAMESVSSLPEHHIHDGSAVISELGGKAVVLDFEFLHDLD